MSSLRRPDGVPIISRIIGETRPIAPVHIHHINLGVAVTLRGKRYLAPIRLPRRIVAEVGLIGAVGVHYVDFIVMTSSKLLTEYWKRASFERTLIP